MTPLIPHLRQRMNPSERLSRLFFLVIGAIATVFVASTWFFAHRL